MAFDKKGTWTLSKNEKRDRDTSPEYTGSLTDEDGNEFWLNAWVRESKDGRKFFSGRMKRKEQKGPTPSGGGAGRLSDQLSDEIPFIYEWR